MSETYQKTGSSRRQVFVVNDAAVCATSMMDLITTIFMRYVVAETFLEMRINAWHAVDAALATSAGGICGGPSSVGIGCER